MGNFMPSQRAVWFTKPDGKHVYCIIGKDTEYTLTPQADGGTHILLMHKSTRAEVTVLDAIAAVADVLSTAKTEIMRG
jgi:hypothetical protein